MEKSKGKAKLQFSAGGVVMDNDKVLILERKDRGDFVIPKGHIEQDEKPEEAALREVQEETGYQNLEIIKPLGRSDYFYKEEGKTIHKFVYNYLFRLKDEEKIEHKTAEYKNFIPHWLTIDQAIEKASYKDIKKLLEKIQNPKLK